MNCEESESTSRSNIIMPATRRNSPPVLQLPFNTETHGYPYNRKALKYGNHERAKSSSTIANLIASLP